MEPKTERGKWNKAKTGSGSVSPKLEAEREFNGEKPKGNYRKIIVQ